VKVPTTQTAGRREAVRGMFAAISPSYDRLNHLLSAGQDIRWRRRAVAMFGPDVKRVLDVAAGTGDLSAAWLTARTGNEVLATDFVPEMCMAGAAKLGGRPGLLGYAVADALALPAPDGAFDGVMAAFGVRNFENLGAGLAEMARVLRPGGEIVVLEFFPARMAFVDRIFRSYFHHVLPRVGAMISGDREAYSYLPKSVGDFVSREAFALLLKEAGFDAIEARECSGGIATAFHAVMRDIRK
jgi:demethylmenaquinone methyltransferase / 2-methoxy-6-polyprenyl-1,4-benzoquinol methylase